MSESVVHSEENRVGRMVDRSQRTMPTLASSSLTNNTFIDESGLNNDQKKRKMEDIYSGGRWKEVDEYEVMKVRKVIRNHILNI